MRYFIVSIVLLLLVCSTANSQDKKLSLSSFIATDLTFNQPYIDIDENRTVPVPHRYVHGGFRNTETKFSIYFPSKDEYEGRFFQYITPFPDNENLSQGAIGEEDKIGFAIGSGAYFIETNGGGRSGMGMMSGSDPTIGAFRANAACAQVSREIAKQVYERDHRPFGYCFGGSGGAFRTIGGIENTKGVWDGAVPYVVGSPVAIPNVFSVRMHAMRILNDKFPQIIDALEPGGSGDMYAGLNSEQTAALKEVTKMGFPPRSWFGYKTMGMHGFTAVYGGVMSADSKYFTDDFWNTPGYPGADNPASFSKYRVQKNAKIKKAITSDEAVRLKLMEAPSDNERGSADLAWKSVGGKDGGMPVAFQLDQSLPNIYFLGGELTIKSGKTTGTLIITTIANDVVMIANADPKILLSIQPGDEVVVDNSNFLAAQTYHRHQVPSSEYHVWDQFRDANGKPIYPQRPMQLGPLFTQAASGVLPAGKIKAKVIVLSSLLDREAFPWQADWYRSKVKEQLGDSTDNYFRLWYTDHALHGDATKQEYPTQTVSYLGVLQQALRDLSAWVEKGIAPPATTKYKIEDGQVIVAATAKERLGIQPTIVLKVNGKKRAAVKVNEKVNFEGLVELPPSAGELVEAKWDFEGSGAFDGNQNITLKTSHKFTKAGTYYVTLQVVAQRHGDKTPYARIQNLERVRVDVK